MSGSGSHPQVARSGPRPFATVGAVAAGLALAFSLGFATLALSVLRGERVATIDSRITTWFVHHRSDTRTALFRTVTHLADPLVITAVVAVVALMLVFRGQRRAASLLIVSSVGTALLVRVAKMAIGRARPSGDRLASAAGAAFPSGHAAQSVACYVALAIVVVWLGRSRSAAVVAIVAAASICVFVGLSRVYLGVHWASDVIAGWSLGAAWLAGTVAVFARAGWFDSQT